MIEKTAQNDGVVPSLSYNPLVGKERPLGGKKPKGQSTAELGAAWGAGSTIDPNGGRVTRRSEARSMPPIPGGLNTSIEESGVQAGEEGLDQPKELGGDRPGEDLDQPGTPGGDRSPKTDQSINTEGVGSEKENPDSPRSQGEEAKSQMSIKDFLDGLNAGRRKTRFWEPDDSRVEVDLLNFESEGEVDQNKNFPRSFSEEFVPSTGPYANDDGDDDDIESDVTPKASEIPEREASKKKPVGMGECREDKGEEPVRAVGFRDIISNVSRVGPKQTVPRNERPDMATAAMFHEGRSNIPGGVAFTNLREVFRTRSGSGRGSDEPDNSRKSDKSKTPDKDKSDDSDKRGDNTSKDNELNKGKRSRKRSDSYSSSSDTGGEGAWKPVITCWVHLELMCIFPTM